MIGRRGSRRLPALLLGACVLADALAARGEESDAAGVEEGAFDSAEPGVYDPLEGFNRAIFAFNETVDRYAIEPIAIGWDWVLPNPVQEGIDNFFDNLAVPRRIVNDLLQGKPGKAGQDFGRFLVNTSFGLAGLFDPATDEGFGRADEDFGQTLGVWGVPFGPYLVLPLLGPSSPRDTAGLAVDGLALSPERYFFPYYVNLSLTGTQVINHRSLVLESVRAERESAFDFYTAVRGAYVPYRENLVRDRADDREEEDEDLYYFDEDEQ